MNVMRDFWNMRFCVENIFLGVIRCHEIAPELFGYGAYRFQIHLALGRGIAFRVLLGKAKGDMQVTAIAFLPGSIWLIVLSIRSISPIKGIRSSIRSRSYSRPLLRPVSRYSRIPPAAALTLASIGNRFV